MRSRRRLARKPYWVVVLILLVVKYGLVMSLDFVPGIMAVVRHVDLALMVVLALVVAARFGDAGWPGWLGIVLVFLISVVLPFVLLIVTAPVIKSPNPLDDLPFIFGLPTAALFVLLIVAGIRPSVAVPAAATPRIEPTPGGAARPQ